MLQIIHIREVYYLSLLCAIKGKPVNGRQNSSLIEERKKIGAENEILTKIFQ